MPQFIGVVIAIGLYIWFCYVVLVHVLVPAFPFLVVIGCALGAVLVVAVLAATLLRMEAYAATTVTPVEVAARLPKPRTPFPRDRAWPNYLFAQSRDDLSTALDRTATAVARVWGPARVVADEPVVLLAWPLLLIPLVAAIALTAGVVVAGLVTYVVMSLALALAWLGWLAVVAFLRGVDVGTRRLRGAKATCARPRCNHRNLLPAYRCTCGQVHHDIRAGRLGAFARRCECGKLLPTTVLKAAVGLMPECQKCGEPLRGSAGILTDILFPVFGPASAGKTRLVFAGMVALDRHLMALGGAMHTIDPDSEATFQHAVSVVESRTQTTKTDAAAPPAGITVHLTHARHSAHLHLFDAAGEFYANREQNSELSFLDDAEGLVFVVDPFSIPAVIDELTGALAPRLTAAHAALMDPEQSYLVTVQRLDDQGVKLDRKPLAVAVVKADLLLGVPCAAGLSRESTSETIESWLRDRGLDNLVVGATRDFAAVRYFLVSSLDETAEDDGTAGATSAARPLLWLLGRSRMPVPERVLTGAS
jgi:hypothetical protein